MLTILVDRGALSSDVVDSPDSPQHQALTWLSGDPSYAEYDEDRAIQRWVLATMALSLESLSTAGTGRRTQTGTIPGWLEYTDECTWFTSSDGPICNPSGLYETIDVQDMNLEGFLPTELALLSNSLRKFSFDVLCVSCVMRHAPYDTVLNVCMDSRDFSTS